MMRLAKKVWIPLVIIIVVAIAGFTVHRIRTFFGAEGIIVTPKVFADDPEPFDPKVVKYEIFGTGSYADINYLDNFNGPTDAFVTWGNQWHEDRYIEHQHHITNVNIDLDDEEAHVVSYVIFILRQKDNNQAFGSGRYVDQFEKRGGEWRIAVREFLPEMRISVPVAPRRELPVPPGNGRWDKQDISYEKPLRPRRERR